jgi:hypothetical protein
MIQYFATVARGLDQLLPKNWAMGAKEFVDFTVHFSGDRTLHTK